MKRRPVENLNFPHIERTLLIRIKCLLLPASYENKRLKCKLVRIYQVYVPLLQSLKFRLVYQAKVRATTTRPYDFES